jgi:hypothetical protein
MMNSRHFQYLAQVGIALSKEKDINKLLEIIVDGARSLTGADGGTLYLIDKQKMQLRFEILQNDTMKMRMGGTTGVEITLPPVPLFDTGQPNHANVSSYVALTEKIVNVPISTRRRVSISPVQEYTIIVPVIVLNPCS